MNARATLRVPLAGRRIAEATTAVVILNGVMLLGTYLGKTVFRDGGALVQLTIGELNLTGEDKIAPWYSSMLLLTIALAALGCWNLDRRAVRTGRDRILTHAWAVVALLFAGLSLDEMGSLHERLPALLKVSLSESLNGWVEVFAIPIALVALFLLAFAWFRLRQSPAAAVLMALGALLFVSVPVQEQFEVTTRGSSALLEAYQRPVALALLEEGTEIFGMLCFLAAFLLYARMRVAGASDRATPEAASFSPDPFMVVVGISISAAAMLFLVFGLLPQIPDQPQWGDPFNWLPSSLAFAAALLAWLLWRDRSKGRFVGRGSPALLILAIVAVGISADHGAGHRFTTHVLSNHFAVRLALDAALAAAVLTAAAGLVPLRLGRWDHVAIAGWAVLQSAALFSGLPWNPLLSTAAFTVLLPALVRFSAAGGKPHDAEVGSSSRDVRRASLGSP